MKSHFIVDGNTLRPHDPASIVVHETLEPAVYAVGLDQRGWFLTKIEDFILPAKVYGEVDTRADRILNTFYERSHTSTGVLLTGEKGSGKTMLTKSIAMKAKAAGLPIIVVNQPYHGDSFNGFIQSIAQPAVVLFDEFEKVYSRDKQPALLTLLDGTFNSHKLFMLTCNDQWRIDDHMRNRPGRIYYFLTFKGLEKQFITEYCQDVLVNKDHIESVLEVAESFKHFNFDMLKALVEDMNRYEEDAFAASKILNVRPEMEMAVEYDYMLLYKGQPVKEARSGRRCTNNPAAPDFETYTQFYGEVTEKMLPELRTLFDVDEGDTRFSYSASVNHDDFVGKDPKAKAYVYAINGNPELAIAFFKKPASAATYSYGQYAAF